MIEYKFDDLDNIILSFLNELINEIPSNTELFILECKKSASKLPIYLKNILKQFLTNGSEKGFLLFKNIRFNEILPETPSDNNLFIGETTKYAKTIAIINEFLGEMIAYEGEGYGRLFQDMVPKKSLSNTQTSLGSKIELEIHTEQAFSNLRPDILTLGCLRGDKNAITYVLPVKKILDNLDEKKIKLLREPLWKIGVDLSFKMNFDNFIEGDIRGPIPIIYGSEEDPYLVFDQDLMKGINEEAEELKNEIVEIYYKHRYSHILKPGEIIFIDNQRAVHGRSSFQPNFDGKDRFIIRSFVTLNYDKSLYARKSNSRIVEAKYS